MAQTYTVTVSQKFSIGSRFISIGTISATLSGTWTAGGETVGGTAAGFRKAVQLPTQIDVVLVPGNVAGAAAVGDGFPVSLTSSGLLNLYDDGGSQTANYGLIEYGANALPSTDLTIPFIAIGY